MRQQPVFYKHSFLPFFAPQKTRRRNSFFFLFTLTKFTHQHFSATHVTCHCFNRKKGGVALSSQMRKNSILHIFFCFFIGVNRSTNIIIELKISFVESNEETQMKRKRKKQKFFLSPF